MPPPLLGLFWFSKSLVTTPSKMSALTTSSLPKTQKKAKFRILHFQVFNLSRQKFLVKTYKHGSWHPSYPFRKLENWLEKLVQNTLNISTVYTIFKISTYRTCSLDRILVFHYTLAKAIHLEYPNSSPVVASWQRSVSCCLPDPWIREEVHRRNCIRNTPNPDAVSRSLQWTNQKLKKIPIRGFSRSNFDFSKYLTVEFG